MPIKYIALHEEGLGNTSGIKRYGEVLTAQKIKRGRIPVTMRPGANPEELYYYFAVRKWIDLPQAIEIRDSFKGKPQDKRFQIGDGLWYQMMDMCFPAFANSKLDEILFYPIGTGDNRGAMSLGEFAAKKIGTENVSIDGKTYSCVKISMVLTMFSWAWTGLFWVDTATGQLVQSGVKKGNKEKPEWQLKELTYKK